MLVDLVTLFIHSFTHVRSTNRPQYLVRGELVNREMVAEDKLDQARVQLTETFECDCPRVAPL